MEYRESETVELKAIVVDEVKKVVIAFANCEGGKLYVGIDDAGKVIGVNDADATTQQLSNMVRDSIKPDVTMFVHYETVSVNGKQIIVADVQRGTERPYYLAKKGLRPEGVYVRQGTSSVPATDTAIRRMIKETDGDSFEQMRSLEQNLTFSAAEKEFAQRAVAFGAPQKKTLGLLTADEVYTNLGLLLSDQCVHTIKGATFEGTDQSVFKDRREFSGSLLKQLNEVYEYIELRNQTRSTFNKLYRIDSHDYPETAIREALLNALVHRDYSFSASTLISVYADRMEFVSIGGLLPGVTLEDVMLGLSVCRNAKLANVFYRLELIEAYGTGMRKIMSAYANTTRTPQIQATDNAFKIILPNLNVGDNMAGADSVSARIIEMIRQNETVTRKDVEQALGIPQTTAGRMIRNLLEGGHLVQEGKGKNTRYRLPT